MSGEVGDARKRLAPRVPTLREKVEALAKEVDVYYPIKFQFGAEANYIAGYTDMRSRLRALLAEVEPQPSDPYVKVLDFAEDIADLMSDAEPQPEPEGERTRFVPSGKDYTPHNHAEYVPGCFRCDLTLGELGIEPAPVSSPVAAEERPRCHQCGPGYWIGDDGCRHTAPEPVAAAPNETVKALARVLASCNGDFFSDGDDNDRAVYLGLARAFLASDWLRDHDARVVAEAKAEAWDEAIEASLCDCGNFDGHPGDCQMWELIDQAPQNPYRAALVGGPDETGGES